MCLLIFSDIIYQSQLNLRWGLSWNEWCHNFYVWVQSNHLILYILLIYYTVRRKTGAVWGFQKEICDWFIRWHSDNRLNKLHGTAACLRIIFSSLLSSIVNVTCVEFITCSLESGRCTLIHDTQFQTIHCYCRHERFVLPQTHATDAHECWLLVLKYLMMRYAVDVIRDETNPWINGDCHAKWYNRLELLFVSRSRSSYQLMKLHLQGSRCGRLSHRCFLITIPSHEPSWVW